MHDDFFEGTGGFGGFGFKFAEIGSRVWGEIVDIRKSNARKYNSNPPVDETFPDGTVRTQLEITLQTNLRGWAGLSKWPTDTETGQPLPAEEDTGLRKLFVKERSNLQYRMGDALVAAGQNGQRAALDVGGMLSVTWESNRPSREGNDAKQYAVQYKAAPPKAADQGFFQGQPAQPAPPAVTAPPAQPGPTPPTAPTAAPAPPPAQTAPPVAPAAPTGAGSPAAPPAPSAPPPVAPPTDPWNSAGAGGQYLDKPPF